jgi:amino acid transporter
MGCYAAVGSSGLSVFIFALATVSVFFPITLAFLFAVALTFFGWLATILGELILAALETVSVFFPTIFCYFFAITLIFFGWTSTILGKLISRTPLLKSADIISRSTIEGIMIDREKLP